MQVARVVGTVVCAHKDERLSGLTLLLIQPLAKDGAPFGTYPVSLGAADTPTASGTKALGTM